MGSPGARDQDSSTPGELDPNTLQQAISEALRAAGAHVVISPTADNLVRRAREGEPWQFVVESQGLPNLLHEFVHIVLFGRLEDDHGIDYQAIPFDMHTPGGRAVLFDELACAVWSCEWMVGTRPERDEWFAEQLSIQPVFYGFEQARYASFVGAVDDVRRAHEPELLAVLERARRGAIAWVGEAALPTHPRVPDLDWRFARLSRDL